MDIFCDMSTLQWAAKPVCMVVTCFSRFCSASHMFSSYSYNNVPRFMLSAVCENIRIIIIIIMIIIIFNTLPEERTLGQRICTTFPQTILLCLVLCTPMLLFCGSLGFSFLCVILFFLYIDNICVLLSPTAPDEILPTSAVDSRCTDDSGDMSPSLQHWRRYWKDCMVKKGRLDCNRILVSPTYCISRSINHFP